MHKTQVAHTTARAKKGYIPKRQHSYYKYNPEFFWWSTNIIVVVISCNPYNGAGQVDLLIPVKLGYGAGCEVGTTAVCVTSEELYSMLAQPAQ
jgi:hypothetical protein